MTARAGRSPARAFKVYRPARRENEARRWSVLSYPFGRRIVAAPAVVDREGAVEAARRPTILALIHDLRQRQAAPLVPRPGRYSPSE